jgi:uncharacterized protein (TIGR03437 family)
MPAGLRAQTNCVNIAGGWQVRETATLKCTETVAGQSETYSDPLGASRSVTIVQDSGSCSFRYDPGTIGAGTLIQYVRTEVTGEIVGDMITASGGNLLPAPGVQLLESSFQATGQVSGNSMTLSGSGPFKINQPVEGGQIANLNCTLTSTAVFTRSAPPPPPPPPPPPSPLPTGFVWTRQFSSSGPAVAPQGVAVDASGVYVAGNIELSQGALPGQTSFGGFADAFVRKYDANGTELWTRQFGTAGNDAARGIALDASGVYVVGNVTGALPGQPGLGTGDAFVRKYDVNGTEIWTRQFGTAVWEQANGVAVDATGVYVVGYTEGALPGQTSSFWDAFVRKYDANGSELWTRQFSSVFLAADTALGVAAGATGIYIVGHGDGALPGQTGAGGAFIRRYDANGNELWTRQFASATAYQVAADATGVYIVGNIAGALPGQTAAGFLDAFVRKYDVNGNELWTHQFGFGGNDFAYGVALDATGVYVAGTSSGALPGQINSGLSDAYARKYDVNGNELWTRQFGSTGDDQARGVAVDASGVYAVGLAGGRLPGSTSTGTFFVLKMAATAPPSAVAVNDGGVVNNASFASSPAPVAPGSMAAVFGSGLNTGSSALSSSFGPDGKLVTSLGGTSVTVNNIPAPMFYSTAGQLGIQIPFELAGQTSATIQVAVGGQASPPRTIFLDAFAPGIFTVSQDGRGAAAAFHQDGVIPVTAQNPARPGEVVVFFGTGLGALNPPLATGAPSLGNRTASTLTASIDGVPGEVQFSGAAPGFVGLNQVNVRIPATTRSASNLPVLLSIGGKQSNSVTIAVAP